MLTHHRVIDCSPIVGTPFESGGDIPRRGMDCWGVARWVVARCGLELPALSDCSSASIESVEAAADAWELVGTGVGCALEACDLVLCRSERSGSHVAVLVDEARALLATAFEGGRVMLVPRWSLQNVVAVYRPKATA